MDMITYQKKALKTDISLKELKLKHPKLPQEIYTILSLNYAGLGLGEAGEIQGKIKKIIRDNGGTIDSIAKEAIVNELGDLLWYVAQVCTVLETTLEDVATRNIDKLNSRMKRGVIKGNGDNR